MGAFLLDRPTDYVLQVLRFSKVWEPHVMECAGHLLASRGEPSAFVDCGAHIGTHTLAAAHLEACRHVLALEMQTETHRRLLGNIALNAEVAPKITAVRAVLSSQSSLRVLVADGAANESNSGMARILGDLDDCTGKASYRPDREVSGPRLCDQETVTLDEVVEAHLPANVPVGVVKIDVEGHELEVLRGAARTLQRWRPALIVEVWDDQEARAHGLQVRQADVLAAIQDLGFKGFLIKPGACDFLFVPTEREQDLKDAAAFCGARGKWGQAGPKLSELDRNQLMSTAWGPAPLAR